MTLRPSERLARTLKEHPPTLELDARDALEERVIEAALLRAVPPARTHEELAGLLLAAPPSLDPGERRRLEEALVAARRGESAHRRSRGVVVATLAVAAAVALVSWGASPASSPPTVGGGASALSFVRLDGDRPVEEGTVEAPRGFTTDASSEVRLAQGASTLLLGPSSEGNVQAASRAALALRLAAGSLRVEFHPAEPGRQALTVETPRARVEVVGTVFTVSVDDQARTEVAVDQGLVRVVDLVEGGTHQVAAGGRLVLGPPAPRPPEGVAAAPAPRAAVVPSPEPRPAMRPADRFREAERLFDRGRYAEAREVLRPMLRSTPAHRARALTIVAESHAREGNFGAAAEAYAEAARRGAGTSHGANASYALGRLAEGRLGDEALARRAYAAYLEARPEGILAAQARLSLCRLGETARCEPARREPPSGSDL